MCLVSCDGFVFVYCVSLNVQYGPGSCHLAHRLEGRLAHCKNQYVHPTLLVRGVQWETNYCVCGIVGESNIWQFALKMQLA